MQDQSFIQKPMNAMKSRMAGSEAQSGTPVDAPKIKEPTKQADGLVMLDAMKRRLSKS